MRWTAQRGSITAEFAAAVPAVGLVLALGLAGMQLGGLQVRAQDAAADTARSWARGDATPAVIGRLGAAEVERVDSGDLVCARVTARLGGGLLAAVGVSGTSCALGGGR
ncbi:hypothetical protein CLV46_0668 [Diaminobutyricimonas aerilata]|uniref:TadE-like protein n=1 Tax=Diaminobutyricimonas aerilata TaxID=1162967 RepID=A0A2M9CGW4_9MICO|nr:hypothetical protein [Diaminobutyricimonas aerilata]PJJ71127.1 hypothetical protein CLV46_0668 [Diaminobutyricimonas aerilata]